MKRKIHKIDEEIIDSVSKQSRAGARGRHQLDEARTAIVDLFSKIQEIKTKADNSERMVNDICSDIRDLDYAKRNLSTTTKALTNLQSIVQEMERLKTMLERRNYSEVANLTEAVKEILRLFSDWRQIDRVRELQSAFDGIKRNIRTQVFNEFEHVDANRLTREELMNLADACFVVDAMGEDTRRDFIAQWTGRQLGVYDLKFKPGFPEAQLDQVDSRYQWFLVWNQHFEEHFAKVFPPHWRVSEAVAFEFCLRTNTVMLELLEKTKATLNVNALKVALKRTLKFEQALAGYFAKQVVLIPIEDLERELRGGADAPAPAAAAPSAPKNADADAIISQMGKPTSTSQTHDEVTAQVMQKFKGVISMCFEAYMYLYVENQQAAVQSRFNDLLSEEKWTVEESAHSKVLTSARGLFDTLSKARKRVANLNQSGAFFDVFGIFKKFMNDYADRLLQRLTLVNQNAARVATVEDEILCCLMINTGEYCSTMSRTIEKVIRNEIAPKYKEQVSLEKEQNKYSVLIARARETLSNLIATAIEPSFIEMNRINWDRFVATSSVGDASPYVDQVAVYMTEHVPIFRKYIMETDAFKSDVFEGGPASPNYFQIICDTILAYFTRRFDLGLRQCKRVSEAGAQQLVTDLAQFKKILELLPTLKAVEATSGGDDYSKKGPALTAPNSYIKKVKREVEPIEKMLKVIWTPTDMLVDTYKALLPSHTDADFVAIMQLKGVPFAEQHALLDAFGTAKDSPTRDLVTRDWVNSSKNALDNTKETLKTALLSMNFFSTN